MMNTDPSGPEPDTRALEKAHNRRIMLWLTVAPMVGLAVGTVLCLVVGSWVAGLTIGAGCGLTAGIGMTALLGHGIGEDAAAVRSAERRRATVLAVVGLLIAAVTSVVTSTYIYMH
jgi:hypothetical protein